MSVMAVPVFTNPAGINNVVCSQAVSSAFSGNGAGTLSSPYVITNVIQLNEIRNNLSAVYRLDNDIDLSSINNWNPIGTDTNPFTGVFNGNGHIIKNIQIDVNRDFDDYDIPGERFDTRYGFFGTIKNATIEKFGIENADYNVSFGDYSGDKSVFSNVGGIVAHMVSSKISESYFKGRITNNCSKNVYVRVGAIANGAVDNSEITDCYSDSISVAKGHFKNTMVSGGVAWLTDSVIKRSIVMGEISGYNIGSYVYTGGFEASGGSSSYVYNCISALKKCSSDGFESYTDNVANFASKNNNLIVNTDDSLFTETSLYESVGMDFDDIWYLESDSPKLRAFLQKSQGGTIRNTLSGLNLSAGDTLNLDISGDAGDSIQVHFYYTDKNGNYSSTIIGGLGGTVLDGNGKKSVTFTAPDYIDSLDVKIVYTKSSPTYSYNIKHNTTTTTMITTITIPTTTSANQNNKIIVGRDDYSFLNQSAYFNETYSISGEMKKQLDSRAENLEWDKVVEKVSGNVKWDGSCFGLSAVEILAKTGKLDVSNIDRNATCLYDWSSPKNNQKVESIINYYHMLQYSDVFESKSNKFMNMTNKRKIDSLINMVSDVEKGGNPVLVGFNFTESPSSKKCNKGHAVVAYGLEYGSWSYSERYNCRILISDSNVTGFENDNCIYINTENYHWEIPFYQEKYYNCKNTNQSNKDNPLAQIRMATNDLNLIDTFGYLRNGNATKVSDKESKIDINNNTNDFGVSYFNNNSSSDLNDATCDLIFYSGMSGAEISNKGISAILPDADVPYEYFEKGLEAFDTSIEYTNSKLRADVSNGNYAIYKPNESVEFVGDNSDYTLSIVMNSGYHPTDWFKLEVTGENADTAKISVANGGYIISSDSLSDGIFVNVSDRKNKAHLGIATEYKSVLVYEIDENTIGIKVDKNGDGLYETKYTPDYLADINTDGNVSIADAVLLQKYLIEKATINRKQFICGDINMDGDVDVFDMVLIRKMLTEK